MHNLFGTDGIRQTIGISPFTDAGLERLGKALAQWIITNFGVPNTVLIAHDTRISNAWIKATLKSILLRHGISIQDEMVLPTPAAYTLIKHHQELCAAIIISASHNPYYDNGIKIVDRRSPKLSSLDEQHISQLYFQQLALPASYDIWGIEHASSSFKEKYHQHITSFFTNTVFENIRVVLDCAHGATSESAPIIFQSLGAQVIIINAQPTGININNHCGAVHPEHLQQAVLEHKADIGFAFDGDGDRVISVSRDGFIKNGDDILAILLEHPHYRQQSTIVGTVMTNFGFEQYLISQQRTLVRTNVGDKYIAEYLHTHHLLLGGEQSGHIILKDYLGTGDGIFTALRVLETILHTNNWAFETFTKYPQVTLSVPITQRKDLASPELATLIQHYQEQLHAGRLLVRYSGTENVVRVMVEDQDFATAERICQTLSAELQKELQ